VALGDAVNAIQAAMTEIRTPLSLQGSFQGHRAGVPVIAELTALSDRGGADYGLHHPWHPVRELHPADHHPVHVAVGGGRRVPDGCGLAGIDLSVIAMIGIILLIGIVKKNGIMMVDFRHHGRAARWHGNRWRRCVRRACCGSARS